jgi:peptide/nickel transport system ATP-binding protein/oligopeptide transport system ATP-binding protein
MAEPVLEAQGLVKHYHMGAKSVRALDGVSIEVLPGEVLAIVGESGSGKTTLAKLLLGIEAPTTGRLSFQGHELGVRRPLEMKRHIQYVQQNPMTALNPRRTIYQTISLSMRIHKALPPTAYRERTAELLRFVGMDQSYLNRYPAALSGGQRQRVAIARALASQPKLLVLDEPTSALDVSVQAKVLTLLVELQKELGLTYVFITHDLSVVRTIAMRVAVMYQGKLMELGPMADLFSHPGHPYTRMLLSSIPVTSEAEEASKPTWAWEDDPASGGSISHGCGFAPRCPFAERICWDKEPPLAEVRRGHVAACYIVSGEVTGER